LQILKETKRLEQYLACEQRWYAYFEF